MSEHIRQNFTQELDLKGLSCPLPLLKMKLALKQMSVGEILSVETTDSGSWQDFKKFTEITDNVMLNAEEFDAHYQFIIKKGS